VPNNAITPSNLISTAWASPSASFSDDFRSVNNPKFNRKSKRRKDLHELQDLKDLEEDLEMEDVL